MPAVSMDVAVHTLPLAKPFRIAGYVFETAEVVVVTLTDGAYRGRGEASGVYYLGDDVPHMLADLGAARDALEAGITRDALRSAMPPGGGRNAVDAALWDLEAARTGVPAWRAAGLADAPAPLVTTFTLGADTPDAMAAGARAFAQARCIKVKLTGDLALDSDRVAAIRAARPDAWLGIDGNQGFARDELEPLVAAMQRQDVSLIEQPLARGRETDLDGYRSPIPIAADESALTLADVERVAGRFDVFNIKLDKCGGLTEALMIARAARAAGMGVMVGNMVGSSLSVGPAYLLGQLCDLVDLDGPIFLADDPSPRVRYDDGHVTCGPEIWGGMPD